MRHEVSTLKQQKGFQTLVAERIDRMTIGGDRTTWKLEYSKQKRHLSLKTRPCGYTIG